MKRKLSATLGTLMLSWVLAFTGTIFAADADLIQLGKFLFFDKNLSQPAGQSCASCHDPKAGFADLDQTLPVSQGVLQICFGNRNAPGAAYAAFSPPLRWDKKMSQGNMMKGMYVGGLFWDGRVNTLEEQAPQPFLNPLEMHNPNIWTVVHAVRKAEYADLFEKVFGANSLENPETAYQYIAQAIAAYERSNELNPFSSKYDFCLAGQASLTEAEANGLALFAGKANCVKCHSMEPVDGKILFTNFGYQNLGVPKNPDNPYYFLPKGFNRQGENYVDLGIGGVLAARGVPVDTTIYPNATAEKQMGMFKIPSLRNCAITAPYEHNGAFKTLREVVMFNNTRDIANYPPPEVMENMHMHMGGPTLGFFGNLGLNDQEVDDIVAFLEILTDGYQQ